MINPLGLECARLREENEELKHENADLKRQLRGEDFSAPLGWRLTVREEQVVRCLASRTFCPKEALYFALYQDRSDVCAKIVDVFICKIRKKLQPHNLTIETIWGRGYRMSDADRRIVLAASKPEAIAA